LALRTARETPAVTPAARVQPGARAITWLGDDVGASDLLSQVEVIVDRATLHTLPLSRAHAWAATMRRLLVPGGHLVLKTHREGVQGVTSGWTAEAVSALLGATFEVVSVTDGELPGVQSAAPIPSLLVVVRRTPG